ncbi:MAG: 2OG-Fe(II) oxygenase family protein, partial [Pseudomonadota bacterium]|nr:2OG-Fe(II) oxygenase family protein [Pseudomonadota bacterium]
RGPSQAPGTAWQSRPDLHLRPELSGLVDCIRQAVESILDFLKIYHGGVEITGCWANVNAPGTAHGIHSHPNNYLSGVYYVRTPPGADSINLHDPRVQAGIIRPPVTALTAQNTDMVVIHVQPGRLLVFPAWLQHSVSANAAESERVSVSFNVMFTDYTRAMGPPLW